MRKAFRTKEETGKEAMDQVEVKSPYPQDVDSFNNQESFPDLEFVIPGHSESIWVHKRTLAKASRSLKATLNEGGSKIEWPYDTSMEVDRQALIKVLKFFYGEPLKVGTDDGECCAVIAVLDRMDVTCIYEAVELLKEFAMKQAEKDLRIGTKLLKASLRYEECHVSDLSKYHRDDDDDDDDDNEDDGDGEDGEEEFKFGNDIPLNIQLCRVVLTKENLSEGYKEIVDECLMELPVEYLDIMEYGKPHTEHSEFSIRKKFIETHSSQMSEEEQAKVMEKLDLTQLNSREMRQLRDLDIIDGEQLLDMYSQALEHCENEREEESERADVAEMEKDRFQIRADAAEVFFRENCL